MPPTNPHFSLPFRFEQMRSGEQRIATVEDGSLDELGDCVELILRTEQGDRRTLPDFGRPQTLAFMTDRDLARSLVQQAVDDAEPRVQAVVQSADIDPSDPGLHRILTMYEIEVEVSE